MSEVFISTMVRGDRRVLCFPDWTQAFIASMLFRAFRVPERLERVIDVGASCGAFSVPLMSVVPDVSVVAIEPSSWSWPYFEINTRGLGGIELIRMAASDKEERLVLSMPPGEDKRIGIETVYGAGAFSQEVPAARLDDMVSGPVDLIKLDVEGHEEAALNGARGIVSEYHPRLIVELKSKRQGPSGKSVDDLVAFIVRMGYGAPVKLWGHDHLFEWAL
jgi:FkbM family methyltransferase